MAPDTMAPMTTGTESGHYALLRVHGVREGECTNVGLILFSTNGRRVGWRTDSPTRARMRGDLRIRPDMSPVDADAEWRKIFEEYMISVPTREQFDRLIGGEAHQLSFVRFTELRGTVITAQTIPQLWNLFLVHGFR